MLTGSCLCGAIRYEIHGRTSAIGFCHCSRCRRLSGVGGTASVVVDCAQLTWLSGKDQVATFELPSGYGSSFCRICGAPAPDLGCDGTCYSIPVGALDDDPSLRVGDHIFIESKASWEVIGDDGAPRHVGMGPPRPRDW